MNEWAETPLEEVVKLRRGHDLPASARRAGNVPVVSSGGLSGLHDVAIAEGPGVVLGRATNLGQPTWVDGAYWPHNTTLYVEDFLGNNPRWVYWWFKTHDLSGYNSGSVQPMLNRNYIARYPIQLPPLAEQERIAGVLNAFDDLIETNRQLASNTIELQRLLFMRTTAEHPRVPLSSVISVDMGQSPPGNTYNESGEGLPFFQGVKDFGQRFPSKRVYCTSPKKVAEAGDLLLAVRAPIGLVNVATEKCATGRGLAILRSARPATALQALTSDHDLWRAYQDEGTVFSAINRAVISSQEIPWVDDDELEHVLGLLDELVLDCHEHAQNLTRQRDELLPLLMSGKVRVSELEGVA